MKENIYTIGVDVGGSNVKAVLMQCGNEQRLLSSRTEKIRKRNPIEVADECIQELLNENGLDFSAIAYLASTGDGEMVARKTGHFYSMTTHARGGVYLHPGVKTVVDMGALYVRAIGINDAGRVLNYKMTGQCASGSGQFIENISRYLGLSVKEVGEISLQSDEPEVPSGICAVLAETDVINSVSKGISTPNIIKGIHISIANRVIRLLSSLKAESPILLTGGMAMNVGMVQAINELAVENKQNYQIFTHPEAIYAGAIGAAIWGDFRYRKLKEEDSRIVSNLQG